ncbi:uncharacterized protein LOC131604798 [Vicia villosa]|uniref:uncharacterized protein LOC131604798 n=1 Tax=Vicia villosa TaxID=3911 RepID=UPI00273AFBEF|nr:uncharacterized protein LOC131604798 [Vicia villosa]
MMWKIWKSRNECVFSNAKINPMNVGREAGKYVQEFNAANPEKCLRKRIQMGSEDIECSKDCVFINVDAGCFEEGWMAMGMVIRDSKRKVILLTCSRRRMSVEPELAEAMAIEWGILLALQLNHKTIVLIFDAKRVVDNLNGLEVIANIEPVLVDCKNLLKQFHCFSVIFCNCSFNEDAHRLVGIGRRLGSKTWLDLVPPFDVSLIPTSVSV